MRIIDRDKAALLVIDFQARLMPAISGGEAAVASARRLANAAAMLGVPVLFTEQNTDGLGRTVPELRADADRAVVHKMSFDACREAGFIGRLADRSDIVVAGCEAHVCVLQTVFGLLESRRRVFVVADAISSRRTESKEAAIRRMEGKGAEIVTTEMVVFEWLQTAQHPRFRDVLALIK